MSEWTALNVEYMTDDWEFPNLDTSRVSGFTQDEHGGEFDLLLDTFQRGHDSFVASKLRDIAVWHGDPVAMIQVEGSDTSDLFDFKLIDNAGNVEAGWPNERFLFTETQSPVDEIADEIGLRPSWGGNYREYQE